jgi:hypothetical protein
VKFWCKSGVFWQEAVFIGLKAGGLVEKGAKTGGFDYW